MEGWNNWGWKIKHMGIARTTNKFGAVINPLGVRKVQILTIGGGDYSVHAFFI